MSDSASSCFARTCCAMCFAGNAASTNDGNRRRRADDDPRRRDYDNSHDVTVQPVEKEQTEVPVSVPIHWALLIHSELSWATDRGGYEAYGTDDYPGNGGGGVMSSQPSCSQTTPSSATQSIRPVSIKQLQTLGGASGDDDALRLDGQEVLTVRLVELLSNLTPHSMNLRSQLDDDGGQGRRRAAQGRHARRPVREAWEDLGHRRVANQEEAGPVGDGNAPCGLLCERFDMYEVAEGMTLFATGMHGKLGEGSNGIAEDGRGEKLSLNALRQ
uniref:Uncharacterized protein n=2 Tax=Phytophthora fragariae TaxID=53985 RepID=A0A6A3FQA5_9STRA|nr:hypothetical protein PF009_g2151 [Phytophthora fragariae]